MSDGVQRVLVAGLAGTVRFCVSVRMEVCVIRLVEAVVVL